ncbi:mitochondrial folate transporter/carrier-like [Nilaparvata lugens]|uniref:mitochondrial folate transporter/carrier-like n=1 Tax=Nilaparvata lugens TaxID=108931 RepID=UPI00193EA1D2|nr:mitochondrial folate transporter/carrier-like [Nilaparvata lugens]
MVSSSSSSDSLKSGLKVFEHVKYEHLLAGVAGGVASTLVLHPLDLIKIRFAVSRPTNGANDVPQYNGMRSAFSSIIKQEGFKGLYKGLTPNLWGSGSAWGLYFLFYSSIKVWIQGGDTKMPLGPTLHMIAATEAGVLTVAITNPVWVVRTRLCMQYGDKSNYKYTGMVNALSKIYRVEGMRGLYNGFIPSLFGVSHSALHFMAFEEMRNYYNQRYKNAPIDTKLGTKEYLVIVGVSRLLATVVTYPFQVVRARLQDTRAATDYTGTIDCIAKTWRFEGLLGFYKGLSPNLTRILPATMITFTIYENVSRYLLQRRVE